MDSTSVNVLGNSTGCCYFLLGVSHLEMCGKFRFVRSGYCLLSVIAQVSSKHGTVFGRFKVKGPILLNVGVIGAVVTKLKVDGVRIS